MFNSKKYYVIVFTVITALAFAADLQVLVSPFVNNSSEEFGWIGFGIEASVIDDLARIPQTAVISNQDRKRALEELSYQMSGVVPDQMIAKAGGMLGANVMLSGEYTVMNQEIRITSRLALVETGSVISSVKIDGSIKDIFSLQDDIVIKTLASIDEKKSGGIKAIRLTPAQATALRSGTGDIDSFKYEAKQFELNEGVPQESLDIEAAIFNGLNKKRVEAGVKPFAQSSKLASLGRYHSMNMQVYNFFDFVDQNGMGSMGRKLMLAPELFGPSGELIAWAYGATPEKVADTLITQWMQGDAKKELLNPAYNYCGIGVFRGDGSDTRVFCSVVPAALMVELVSSVPKKVALGGEVDFTFRFIGSYPKENVSIVVRYPDRAARSMQKDGSYHEGYGVYKPISWKGEFFTVRIRCDKGRGAYVMQPANGDSFYPFGITFISR